MRLLSIVLLLSGLWALIFPRQVPFIPHFARWLGIPLIVAGIYFLTHSVMYGPGMHEEWHYAERQKQLSEIDPVLLDFASKHDMQIHKDAKGWAIRECNWDWDPTVPHGRQIAIDLSEDGTTYDFFYCAFEHRGREIYQRSKRKKSPWSEIQKSLKGDLEKAYSEVQTWKWKDLPLVSVVP